MTARIYNEPPFLTKEDADTVIARNDPAELSSMVISVSLYQDDFSWAQSICVRLSNHEHFNVRGNAVLGFAHLARRFGRLDLQTALPIIRAAMQSDNEFVRGQAECAVDDVRHFLGRSIDIQAEE